MISRCALDRLAVTALPHIRGIPGVRVTVVAFDEGRDKTIVDVEFPDDLPGREDFVRRLGRC